jgi:hypothetical protein
MPVRSLPVALAGLLVLGHLAVVAAPASADPSPPGPHRPPVDAAVVDPFRAPESPWAPGNRGIEYATGPGTTVTATADGTVVFAGTVAGTRHVTVLHPDGVRTTYSFLTEVAVVQGQRVAQGQPVGVAGPGFHLGARRGDAYFDPATLFAGGPPQVRLVPFEIPPGLGPRGERSAVAQLIGSVGGALGDAATWAFDEVAEGAGAAGAWIRDHGDELLRTLAHYAVPYPLRVASGLLTALRDAHRVAARACTPAGAVVEPPTGRRLALRVGGLGSTSDHAAIDDLDLHALGYAAADIARFSYAGGTTPEAGATFDPVLSAPYDAADSQADLWVSGAALADLVESAAEAAPGVPVDLFAHSQGGLVVRAAVVELVARHGEDWVRHHVGEAVTLGTPHDGADLATAALALQSTVAGDQALEVGEWLTGLDADAPSATQLAETSDFQAQLDDAWSEVAGVVELTSIAARGDVVVPTPRTVVEGGAQVVVSVDGLGAHDALPGAVEAAREVALALADRPPSCRSFDTALRDGLQGQAISLVEDAAGSVAWGWTATRGIFRG